MNPNTRNPAPENPPYGSAQSPESGFGILPQTVHGASQSVAPATASSGAVSPALHPLIHSFNHPFDELGFGYPPEMPADPDFDFDDDIEDARNHELLLDDLASDNDDFTRSDEDGWFYSDVDSGVDDMQDSSGWED